MFELRGLIPGQTGRRWRNPRVHGGSAVGDARVRIAREVANFERCRLVRGRPIIGSGGGTPDAKNQASEERRPSSHAWRQCRSDRPWSGRRVLVEGERAGSGGRSMGRGASRTGNLGPSPTSRHVQPGSPTDVEDGARITHRANVARHSDARRCRHLSNPAGRGWGSSPYLRITVKIFCRSGGPPGAAAAATSRKYSGPNVAGVPTTRARAKRSPRLTK